MIFIKLLVLVGSLYGISFALPESLPSLDEPLPLLPDSELIIVDPKPYTVPAADIQLLLDNVNNTDFVYVPSGDFETLELEPGKTYSLSNSALSKRAGVPQFAAWGGYGCQINAIVGVQGFGCGVCVGWSGCNCNGALSALLSMQRLGNPKPTASLFKGGNCRGEPHQSIGILNGRTQSCTNSQLFNPNSGYDFFSAILYDGC